MSDFNTRGKLPFTIVSSSVNTGYAAALTASVGRNIDIVNKHKDEYGQTKDSPAQGPFTNQHVGGNQHRHQPINTGNDNQNNRGEAYIVSASAGSIKVYGPDINGLDKPRSLLTRDNTAKSPVNIKNIQTSGNIAGNFEYNYQVVQSVGRRTTNNLINDGFEASGSLTTKFVSGSHEIYTLPNITNNSKSIFVERFNAPGGKEESSRGALDREGEEFSPNNSLTTRNIKVRQPYYNQLTQHAAQFNSGSTNKLLPDTGITDAVTVHGVNRNTIEKVLTFPEIMSQKSILSGSLATDSNDNFGFSIAMNSTGDRVVVTAYTDEKISGNSNIGLAYVFISGTGGWSEQHILSGSLATGSSDQFGDSVAMNADGDRIVVGAIFDEKSGSANSSGLAYIFVSGTGGWAEQHILSGSLATGSSDGFGNSVAINATGNCVVVGARNNEKSVITASSGLAYIFVSGTGGWGEQHILSGSLATGSFDFFGTSVAINATGNCVVVGARSDEKISGNNNTGLAYIFVSGTGGWAEQHILSGSFALESDDFFGNHIAINAAGDRIVVGASFDEKNSGNINTGLAYIYVSGASGWTEQQILSGSLSTESSNQFGYSVAINNSGDRVVVSDTYDLASGQSGIVYLFVSGANGWTQRHIFSGSLSTEPNDFFGSSVVMNAAGSRVVIGATSDENIIGNTETGLAYIFDTTQEEEIINLTTHDNFWVQHAIPSTDLRYKWIAESVSSSQQPIQYQSYNLPYSTGSLYNSNGAYTDISFEQTGPFGDHLGISGAIDKDEMFTSNYTNTMYRDRKYLFFTASNDCFINASSIAQEISEKDFSVSFWVSFPTSASNGEKTLLVYSGSSTQNELVMNVSSSLCGLTISGSQTTTEYQLSSSLLDSSWHLVTVTSDVTTRTRRITTVAGSVIETTSFPTVTNVYLDGGLVSRISQPNKIFNLSQITLSVGRGSELQGGSLDEVYFWNKALTEQEIVEIYRTTKSDYDKQPKKYAEHKLDNSDIPTPTHGYSSDIEKNTTTLLDLVGGKNLTLVNFTSSVNIRPQNSGIISYSTYFNGPYEGASWKSIRNNEHPVTRKLTTENTNIVSVRIPEGTKKVTKVVRGIPVTFQLPGSRKQGQLLNVKESPVYINNKPLKHRFILKDSQDQNVAIETIHTYGNNLQYFANQQLNDTLGLLKTDRQIYNVLYDYYSGETEEIENPIQKLVGYTYSETIFPKPGTGLLKETRQRTDYITDQPGYSIDGYDRQLGTQRVFWRDSQEDRMRTRRAYITSLGDQVESLYDLPFQTPSVAALEYVSESNTIEYSNTTADPCYESLVDFSYKNCSELFQNYQHQDTSYCNAGAVQEYYRFVRPVVQVPELYFFEDINNTSRDNENVILNINAVSAIYSDVVDSDPSSLRIIPSYIYQHAEWITDSSLMLSDFSQTIYERTTNDLGLNRVTEKISGKNPWYDSYEDYYIDIKNLSNDKLVSYSKIPEFIISNHISSLVGEYGGDATKITIDEYTDNLQFTYKKSIDRENKDICEEDTINIVVDSVKKLLPYNGFYPQDRSLQLVNYLKESWLDTSAIRGGIYLRYNASTGFAIEDVTEGKLASYYKIASFLEPLYSPGIFYNLIKSGIAVDWSLYTGSLPGNFSGDVLTPLQDKPQFRVSFEDLVNLRFINSSSISSQNRFMKYKEVNFPQNAGDYSYPASAYFDGYFGANSSSLSSAVYTLSINNFLAESINFFLKDSSLNTFISKPDSDFATLDSSKTYYMDIVLRKNDIVMCEAHSSSLADSFGKMSGRYFGPSFWTGSVADETRIGNGRLLNETLRDPGYCSYTPPYYYGDSVARISFKPDTTRKYSLDEIFADMQIENFNTSFTNNSVYPSGSLYSSFVMPIESSVTIKGEIEQREQTVDIASRNAVLANAVRKNLQNLVGTATSQTGIKRWVISPKMETPVLDFSNQEFIISTNILTQSFADQQIKDFEPTHAPPTASGFGRGMWSGYGEIPTGEKGIFLELRESYPRQLVRVLNPITRQFVETNTGSLLQACGFQQTNDKLSKRIGELADTREISEAIVIIPYLDTASTGKTIRFGGGFSTLTVNDTVEIEGHNFIKINQNIFNYQKTNVLANKPAVDLTDFSVGNTKIQETSISRMLELMSKYVLPPNFDFLLNNDVTPFVMYIAEFTSTLDKQDLADIWQGVMPKIATRAEWEKQVISHKNTQFDFFHGQGLPEDVKFMIFKAKKRAEINYYKMAADSSDDGLFPSIQAGKPPSPYSFNWPYDYCSLVETARVDVEIEYINKSGSNNT